MKKELKKLLKRLFVGAVATTTIISTLSVNSAYAATTDNSDNFQIIPTQNQQSIYRVADKKYINDSYVASHDSYNKYILSDNWVEAFFDMTASINTKKEAYKLVYTATLWGQFEPAKAYRYFLNDGHDSLEADNFYDSLYDKDSKSYIDYSVYRKMIDKKIIADQTALQKKYSGYENLTNYDLNGLGIDSTKKLYLIDMDKLLATNKNAADIYKGNLKSLSEYIMKNKTSIPSNGSAVQIESLDDRITVLNSTPNSGGQYYVDQWYYTIGGSKGDLLSKASLKKDEKNSDYYEVELDYCLQDMYKWPGQRVFNIPFTDEKINETDLNKLHSIGISQDYRMFGSHKETIRVYPNGQIMCKDDNSNAYISIDNKNYFKTDDINSYDRGEVK